MRSGSWERAVSLVALLAAASCAEERRPAASTSPPGVVATTSGTLSLELRDSLELTLERLEDGTSRARVRLARGFGVAPEGTELSGEARVVQLRESEGTLHTARFALAPVEGGPCGSQPVSLALALHRRGENAFVAGSLTAYCGPDRWHGRPARTPLRLTGELPSLAPPGE